MIDALAVGEGVVSEPESEECCEAGDRSAASAGAEDVPSRWTGRCSGETQLLLSDIEDGDDGDMLNGD